MKFLSSRKRAVSFGSGNQQRYRDAFAFFAAAGLGCAFAGAFAAGFDFAGFEAAGFLAAVGGAAFFAGDCFARAAGFLSTAFTAFFTTFATAPAADATESAMAPATVVVLFDFRGGDFFIAQSYAGPTICGSIIARAAVSPPDD